MLTEEQKIENARACSLRWYYHNRERVLENVKKYRKERKHLPEFKEKKRIANRNWKNKNKEHVRELAANWRRKNRDKIRERDRKRRDGKRKPNMTLAERFWTKVRKQDGGCWTWAACRNNKGYGLFIFNGRKVLAHRFSYQIKHGKIDRGLLVCHVCDNPTCVNPSHLFLGSYSDNANDSIRKGRWKNRGMSGEKHPGCKLTLSQVAEIRSIHSCGKKGYADTARRFGVHDSLISKIVRREVWRES